MPGSVRHLLERVAELLLADAVDALDLLLLAQLLRVLRRLAAARRALAVLAGAYGRRSTGHFSVKHLVPFRKSLVPSRRHCLQLGPV